MVRVICMLDGVEDVDGIDIDVRRSVNTVSVSEYEIEEGVGDGVDEAVGVVIVVVEVFFWREAGGNFVGLVFRDVGDLNMGGLTYASALRVALRGEDEMRLLEGRSSEVAAWKGGAAVVKRRRLERIAKKKEKSIVKKRVIALA